MVVAVVVVAVVVAAVVVVAAIEAVVDTVAVDMADMEAMVMAAMVVVMAAMVGDTVGMVAGVDIHPTMYRIMDMDIRIRMATPIMHTRLHIPST